MNNHTQGPWTVDINTNDSREAETVRGPDNVRIAAAYKLHEHREDKAKAFYEARANSRLIAAAPELLAALQDIVDAYQNHFDAMPVAWQTYDNIARAVITKATGDQS